jgi:RNA polymerase sigma factor (sigma-70 family)
MANRPLGAVLRHIRKLAGPAPADAGDGQLLSRFLLRRDEAAFAALVERYGPLVLGACRRVLRHEHDAEDAFQATFLVLAHKAASLDGTGSLAGWLHTVARRVALRLRAQSERRQARERRAAEARPAEFQEEPGAGEWLPLLEEELHALPEKYRAPLVLCHLEGKTHDEAARALGCPAGSLWKRLERGRALLRGRLLRRGVAPSAALLAAAWVETSSAALPGRLLGATARVAALVAAGTAPDAVPVHVLTLADGALRAMALSRNRIVLAVLLLVGLFGGGTAALMHRAFAEAPPRTDEAEEALTPVVFFAPIPPEPEPKETPALAEWPMFRGNPSRSARGRGAVTLPVRAWSVPTVSDAQVKKWLQAALPGEDETAPAVVPAFFPITINGMIVYRTQDGVSCTRAADGKLEWEALSEWGPGRMLKDPQKQAALKEWLEAHQKAGRRSVLVENGNLGTLSSDGERVYVIDDLALPPAIPDRELLFVRQQGFAVAEGIQHSRLQAVDLKTGKLVWELGGRLLAGDADKDPLAEFRDAHFLGAPLPAGGKLYFLFQRAHQLRLACLDPGNLPKHPTDADLGAAVDWTEPLNKAEGALVTDFRRRLYGAVPAHADGVLVCPTNAGRVVGFDPKARKVVWVHDYVRAKLGDALDAGWKATGPVVHDGKVIVTAPDGEEVVCLRLGDGKLRWRAKRAGDLYVAGVFGNDVLLVGEKSCRALSLVDGSVRWKIDTGRPTGLGVAGDGVYYLPLANFGKSREPEVCVLDVGKGAVKAHLKTGKKEALGNLLLHDGRLLSQTATDLSAFADKGAK